MYPGTHGQLGDEDVAAFGEENGCFCRDHLHLWICLHDLLYPCQREMVLLVIVVGGLELGDLLLPVGVEYVAVIARKSLINLNE